MHERFGSQLLSGRPARGPVEVVDRLLAVQAQDPRGARLAIRARTSGLTASDVDRALTDERSLVIGWLNRGTLHLVRSEDYRWLHALTTPQLVVGVSRRLDQEGVTASAAERGVKIVARSLGDGPQTRFQLRDRLRAANVVTEGQALVHILALASIRGIAVRGPMIGKQHGFVLVDDWLPAEAPRDRDAALRELGRRYLRGHAPADDRDLAKWAGITLRDARTALGGVRAPRARGAKLPPPKLLGSFDPLLHGWASREPVTGAHDAAIATGGLFRPFALVNGQAAAVWRLHEGRPELTPLRELTAVEEAALATDAADVVRFFSAG